MSAKKKTPTVDHLRAEWMKIARENQPLQNDITANAMRQIEIGKELNLLTLQVAYPAATVERIRTLGAVKPTSLDSVAAIVEQLELAKRTPSRLILDESRGLIWLVD